MPVHNTEVAAALTKLADLLDIEGDNPFRVRAYRNAARTVAGLPFDLADAVAEGRDLTELPGIGEAIAAKIAEIVHTGHMAALEKETRKLPAALSDLLDVPGLGPRRVRAIYERLGIADLAGLEKAVREGRLRALDGFGAKTEERVLRFLQTRAGAPKRFPLSMAEDLVRLLLARLSCVPGVETLAVAGSYRRRAETVGDVDILAACRKPDDVAGAFLRFEDSVETLAHGATRSSIRLRSGLQVDLRVVERKSFGAALHYFTGSKAHNIAIRTRGAKAGLKINEYGVYRGAKRIGGAAEDEVFAAVGLPFIPPELREDRGEIEAAEAGRLPALIELGDIRGDLQSHTSATDGQATLAEMAEAARRMGWQYLAVTDHSKRLAMTHGLNATRLRRQMAEIDRLNASISGFRVLKSVEVDILTDGSLDLSDDVLADLDLVVAAVHGALNLSRERQTERIIRAMDNPLVSIVAHPTGRRIGERPPCEVDMERIVAAARERGCVLELNAQPARLDLNDLHCRMARDAGVKVAISTDAHAPADFGYMTCGVGQARRGWLAAADIVNTLPCDDLLRALRRA